ncbi:MAG: TerC family protein [Acidobacteria bacterium]|nr:MAG: TerC family protein [Acidobacteriota bacterium]RLE23362.1 MAG: TerC family protein [Acidobacteriota bacterium]
MGDAIALLLLLVGLELVLGVDNVLVISIFVGKLPKKRRRMARIIGLSMAMIARILMVIAVLALASLTNDIIGHFSIRDLVLIAGGMFLLFKAVREIHHTVELKEEGDAELHPDDHRGYALIVAQIVLLDVVFSIDSVITAVGLTNHVWVIVGAVVLSFLLIMAYAGPVGEFIIGHPTLKILALAFLITIGVTIFMEGMHKEVPKAYIYLPMGFALMVELLQMRYEHNLQTKEGK